MGDEEVIKDGKQFMRTKARVNVVPGGCSGEEKDLECA